ncbi:MAG: hypothetical protein JWL69_276 [Phycisphaerales bacterium]|nr:hypothetical protein [Phycisphaerales bacterium]
MPIGSCDIRQGAYHLGGARSPPVSDDEMHEWVPVVRALADIVRAERFDGQSACKYLRRLMAQSPVEPSGEAFRFTELFARIDGSPEEVAEALEQTARQLECGN